MEPNVPPLHPKVAALIESLHLQLVDAVKWDTFACVHDDEPVILKVGSDRRKAQGVVYETKIYLEVLRHLDDEQFERLRFPEYVAHGEFQGLPWLMTSVIEGVLLEHKWSEVTYKRELLGGAQIGENVAALAVDLLRDLRSVDLATLPAFVKRADFPAWVKKFPKRAAALAGRGLIEKKTAAEADLLLRRVVSSRCAPTLFSNGDFHPRNFVLRPDGTVGLVNWEAAVETWEFTALYAWLAMWGNPRWQIAYMTRLKEHFPLEPEAVQIALLVESFDQAERWAETPEETIGFARTQMLSYFRESLDFAYVRGIFGK